jgi:hypothetical protein
VRRRASLSSAGPRLVMACLLIGRISRTGAAPSSL